jgi:hypothetical protein
MVKEVVEHRSLAFIGCKYMKCGKSKVVPGIGGSRMYSIPKEPV